MKKLARDKHSFLFWHSISDKGRKFFNIDTCPSKVGSFSAEPGSELNVWTGVGLWLRLFLLNLFCLLSKPFEKLFFLPPY